ncbi:hypothetical protein PG985_001912 [Apiospora marii]|uniref:uncharacterized protein n=1 Tax=Apiospora marii TaxID=335849 RepID=UPI00312E680F
MPPIKTPTKSDEHIEELLDQMMGPAIELTDIDDPVTSPIHGDETLRVRPLSRQSFIDSEPEASSTPIAPLKPPKTPLNSQRPASVSLSSSGPPQMSSFAEPKFTNPPGQDDDHDHGVSPDQDGQPDQAKASSSSPAASRPVTTCIDTPVTFETTWYTHFAAPEFFICSRCYADHIATSQFRDAFHVAAPAEEGAPRACRFSSPRMKDDLWQKAVASDYLQPVTDWMQHRSRVADCKGFAAGAKGKEGVKWYTPKLHQFPSWFVVCEACYEDRVKVFPQMVSYFRPHPDAQRPEEVWNCDFSVPFVRKEFEKQGPKGDWSTFVREARARAEMPACPGQETAYAYGRPWFRPVHGPDWLLLCAACFLDRVFHTADAGKWAPDEQLSATQGQQVRCPMAQFNISTAMSRAEELKDFTVFWAAMNKLSQERFCDPAGVKDGVWYTLHGVGADAGYQVCSSCYVSVAEPLGVSQFFRRKINIPPGAVLPCCMNPAHPRGRDFYTRLLEMYYTQSPAALAAYADEYAAIPPCPRYNDCGNNNKDRRWYGWKECTVCPECYHEFARKHEALAGLMTLKNDPAETEGDDGDEGVVCEMYSPRMRDLYILCNGTEQAAADPKPLLEFAAERRRVFAETYLRVCKMNPGERMAEAEQVRELQQRWRDVE